MLCGAKIPGEAALVRKTRMLDRPSVSVANGAAKPRLVPKDLQDKPSDCPFAPLKGCATAVCSGYNLDIFMPVEPETTFAADPLRRNHVHVT